MPRTHTHTHTCVHVHMYRIHTQITRECHPLSGDVGGSPDSGILPKVLQGKPKEREREWVEREEQDSGDRGITKLEMGLVVWFGLV